MNKIESEVYYGQIDLCFVKIYQDISILEFHVI